jgi:hypothetical protein
MFTILQSSLMHNLSIFGVVEGVHFEFANLSYFEILVKNQSGQASSVSGRFHTVMSRPCARHADSGGRRLPSPLGSRRRCRHPWVLAAYKMCTGPRQASPFSLPLLAVALLSLSSPLYWVMNTVSSCFDLRPRMPKAYIEQESSSRQLP